MNVKKLIEALECHNPDSEVYFSYNYGDHWHTKVAGKVRDVEEMPLKYSEYHRMTEVVEDEEDETETKIGVVIS